MGFLDSLKNMGTSLLDDLNKEANRFMNRGFMEATGALCYQVAAASGGISSEEKQKMVQAIKVSPALQGFDVSDIVTEFNKHVENAEFDSGFAFNESMKVIDKLKGDNDAAVTLLRIGMAVGGADGDFDAQEQAVVRTARDRLGLTSADIQI